MCECAFLFEAILFNFKAASTKLVLIVSIVAFVAFAALFAKNKCQNERVFHSLSTRLKVKLTEYLAKVENHFLQVFCSCETYIKIEIETLETKRDMIFRIYPSVSVSDSTLNNTPITADRTVKTRCDHGLKKSRKFC